MFEKANVIRVPFYALNGIGPQEIEVKAESEVQTIGWGAIEVVEIATYKAYKGLARVNIEFVRVRFIESLI